MADNTPEDLEAGALNLLYGCAELEGGESIVIFHENPGLGWYDLAAPQAVADAARARGHRVTMIQVEAPGRNEHLVEAIEGAMHAHDQTIYFARLGDQDRFAPSRTKRPAVMSYVVDAPGLASAFGTFPQPALAALKNSINRIMECAGEIRVTCRAGTDLVGDLAAAPADGPEDVSVRRFPVGIYKPLSMRGFSGRIALTRFVVPTGSRPYDPPVCPLSGTVFAEISGTRIAGFSGSDADVAALRHHYDQVSGLFGIDPGICHSWHSGLHPACAFPGRASDDPDRWGNTIFMNPRTLHVHTCGDYAPGEICWMVIDPVIEVDGVVLWQEGRINRDGFAPLQALVAEWPELDALLSMAPAPIGLD